MTRKPAVLGAALAVAAALAAPVHAAAPRLVMISGDALDQPIVLSDWGQIADLVSAVAGAPEAPRARAGRPSLELALFWGPRWDDYLRQGRSLAGLRRDEADQVGRFFPAWKGRPAAIDLPWSGRWPRVVPASGLGVLERHGVPTEFREGTSERLWWVSGTIGGLALAAAGLAVLARRRGGTEPAGHAPKGRKFGAHLTPSGQPRAGSVDRGWRVDGTSSPPRVGM